MTKLRSHIANMTAESYFRPLSSYIIFLYATQVCIISISLAQIRISQWIAAVTLLISVSLAFVFYFSFPQNYQDNLHAIERLPRWGTLFLDLTGTSLIAFVFLWAAAYLMPELFFDGLSYHIPSISLWDSTGYIHWIPTTYLEPLLNGYPKGAELIGYMLVRAFGDNQLINTFNLLFIPLGVLGIAYIARSLGSSSEAALFVGAAFILIPVNINQSPTTYVDSAFASSAIGFIASLIRTSEVSVPSWKMWKVYLPLGGAMALTIGTKGTGVALCGIGVVALLALWAKRSLGWSYRRTSRYHVRWVIFLLIVIVIALAGGGYWYVRNYLKTGTPFYPIGLTLFGQTVFPGVTSYAALGENANTPEKMRTWPSLIQILSTWSQGLNQWPATIERSPATREGGLGFLWLLGCVPAIFITFLSLRNTAPMMRHKLFILLAVVGSTFLTMPMNWWARYTVWIYALGLPCFAVVLDRFILNNYPGPTLLARLSQSMAYLWFLVCLFFWLFEGGDTLFWVIDRAAQGSLQANPSSVLKPQTWQWPAYYLLPEARGTVLEQVLRTEGITVAVGPANWKEGGWRMIRMVGQLSQPIGTRRLVFLDGTEDMAANVLDQPLSFVIWDKDLPIPSILKSSATRSDEVGVFFVLTMPEASTTPD